MSPRWYRSALLALGIALVVVGVLFGSFVWFVGAPVVWALGFVVASFGLACAVAARSSSGSTL